MAVTTIQFTQEQARSLVGVTPGDLRHWRKAVPYLAAKVGKSARFTFADLIGLGVTYELICEFGVHITAIGGGVDKLFRILGSAPASEIEDGVVLVSGRDAALGRADQTWPLRTGPVLIVRCQPLISRIKERMTPFPPQAEQVPLPFPPQAVRAGR